MLPGTRPEWSTRLTLDDAATPHDAAGSGELWIRGPQVMRGYLENPAATADAIVEDGWLRTGDVVQIDESGTVWVVDRLKEIIKYKGYQIAPAELEAVLREHPLVIDVAVIGVADTVAGEIPKAFRCPQGDRPDRRRTHRVVCRTGCAVQEAARRRVCRVDPAGRHQEKSCVAYSEKGHRHDRILQR